MLYLYEVCVELLHLGHTPWPRGLERFSHFQIFTFGDSNDYGLGLRLISVVAARAAFCILFCVTPFISMNGMKPVHITKKARATTGTFAGK